MAEREKPEKDPAANTTDVYGVILRRILGILLVLSFVGMLWGISDNTALIQSLVSPEISLLILLIIPLPILIIDWAILTPAIYLIVYLASLPLRSIIYEPSYYDRDMGEFTITLTYAVGFCATIALMANLFLSLPESIFANIFEHGLIFLILPLYIVDFALLAFYYKNVFIHKKPKLKKSLARIFVFRNVAAFWIISLFVMSLIVGFSSSELMESIKGSVILCMVFPQILVLAFFIILTKSYFTRNEPGPVMGGPEMLGYIIYTFFVIAGAVSGAIAYLIASIL